MECEICLPCNHKVGSRCIATWLNPTGAANNSCPLCRHVFFPAQPRPYLEHEVREEDQSSMVNIGAYNIPGPADHSLRSPNHAPITPDWSFERSFADILPISTLQQRIAQNAENERLEAIMAEEEDALIEILNSDVTERQMVKAMCETYCHRLNLTSSPIAIPLSQHLAAKMYLVCRYEHASKSASAAVSVFVASHLIGAPRTPHWVSMMCGIDAGVITGLYWFIRRALARVDLVDEDMLTLIDRGDLETVLGFLPEVSV